MPLNARLLRQLETLTLDSKRKFLGQRHGLHRSIRRGQGLEFSDYRQYELGDNPRHIDWGVFGRSDKLFVKRFLEDQDLSALLILDASGSMTVAHSEDTRLPSKWGFACDLAEAVTYVALMGQDCVRIVVPGAPPSAAFRGPRSFHAATRFLQEIALEDVAIRTGERLARTLAEAAAITRFPGIALFVSDCLFPFEDFTSSMSALRARNLEIRVIQLLLPSDIEPFPSLDGATVVDRETNQELSVDLSPSSRALYAQLVNEHLRKLETYCHRSGIGLLKVVLDQPSAEIVIPTLLKTGLLE